MQARSQQVGSKPTVNNLTKNAPPAVENPAAESVETLFYISFGCPHFYIRLDDKGMRKITSKNPSDPSREPKQVILSH